MKVSITNIENNYDGANIMIKQIVKEVIDELGEDNEVSPRGIQLEELSAVFTVKPSGQDDHHIISVEHDGIKEMLEVDYNLRAGVKKDNVELSLFSDRDKEIIYSDANKRFDTVEPKLDVAGLTPIKEQVVGDMVLQDFILKDGRKAQRVFQVEGNERRLIQEFSFKEEE